MLRTRSRTKIYCQRNALNRLQSIPDEIVQLITKQINPIAIAALCTAFPPFVKPITDKLIRDKLSQKYDIFRIGVTLWQMSPKEVKIDEEFLRRYVKWNLFSASGCQALYEYNPSLYVSVIKRNHAVYIVDERPRNKKRKTLVRYDPPGDMMVKHYAGAMGKERLIYIEQSPNFKLYYEGARKCERLVRMQLSNGNVLYYDGGRGAERLVRIQISNGNVEYYDGVRGAERLVRREITHDFVVAYFGAHVARLGLEILFAGEARSERVVRISRSDGAAVDYQSDAQRVRITQPNGDVVMKQYNAELYAKVTSSLHRIFLASIRTRD